MRFLIPLCGLLCTTIAVFSAPVVNKIRHQPHQLRFGPDVYYRDYDEKGLPPPGKSHEFGWLYGFNLGYDYIKPCSFYFGSDVNFSWGKTVYDGSLVNILTEEIVPYENRTHNFIFDFEARAGYTFGINGCSTFSPFVGVGYHFWHRGSAPDNPYGYDEDYQWPYASLGFRSEYFTSRQFSIGLNFKTMLMFDGEMTSSDLPDKTFHLGSRVQYAVEVPLTYYFAYPKWWIDSIRLTPYYCNRDIGRSNTIIADLPFIGPVALIEPDSETHVIGARLELMCHF